MRNQSLKYATIEKHQFINNLNSCDLILGPYVLCCFFYALMSVFEICCWKRLIDAVKFQQVQYKLMVKFPNMSFAKRLGYDDNHFCR